MGKLILSKVVVIPFGVGHGEPNDQASPQARNRHDDARHRAFGDENEGGKRHHHHHHADGAGFLRLCHAAATCAEIPFAKKRKIRKTNNSHFWIVLHHFLDQRSIPANGFVSISFSDFTILAVFGAHGVVIADVWQAYVGAELAQVGVLFVVMFAATVVMAGGVAINHGPGEIARNDFVNRHGRGTAVQGDTQLVEQLLCRHRRHRCNPRQKGSAAWHHAHAQGLV